jgi:hypothetical protein
VSESFAGLIDSDAVQEARAAGTRLWCQKERGERAVEYHQLAQRQIWRRLWYVEASFADSTIAQQGGDGEASWVLMRKEAAEKEMLGAVSASGGRGERLRGEMWAESRIRRK